MPRHVGFVVGLCRLVGDVDVESFLCPASPTRVRIHVRWDVQPGALFPGDSATSAVLDHEAEVVLYESGCVFDPCVPLRLGLESVDVPCRAEGITPNDVIGDRHRRWACTRVGFVAVEEGGFQKRLLRSPITGSDLASLVSAAQHAWLGIGVEVVHLQAVGAYGKFHAACSVGISVELAPWSAVGHQGEYAGTAQRPQYDSCSDSAKPKSCVSSMNTLWISLGISITCSSPRLVHYTLYLDLLVETLTEK